MTMAEMMGKNKKKVLTQAINIQRTAQVNKRVPRPAPRMQMQTARSIPTRQRRTISSKAQGVSYSEGLINMDIEQAKHFHISARNGPLVTNVRRAADVLAPYARISTSSISGFNVSGTSQGVASNDEFLIGTIKVYDYPNTSIYDKAIAIRKSPSSDDFIVIPLDKAVMTTKGGIPLGVDIEIKEDYQIPSSKGPLVNGNGQKVTIFAPFVEMVSGDVNKGFAAGGALSDSFYIGKVKVGNRTIEKAIVMHESETSDRYMVVPLVR